jgi:hypothetical protein
LPPTVVEIVPSHPEYVYFVIAYGTIVIVDSDNYEVERAPAYTRASAFWIASSKPSGLASPAR